MKKIVLVLMGMVCAVCYKGSIVCAPFGMFRAPVTDQIAQQDASFGHFDTPEIRSQKCAAYALGTTPEQLEYKEQQDHQAAIFNEILQLREAKRALRVQYLAQTAPSVGQVGYKFKNRVNQMHALSAQESNDVLASLAENNQLKFAVVQETIDNAMPKDFAYKPKTQDKQTHQRCTAVQELALKHAQGMIQLMEAQQHMVLSLRRDLMLLRKLVTPEPCNYLAQLAYPSVMPLSIQ